MNLPDYFERQSGEVRYKPRSIPRESGSREQQGREEKNPFLAAQQERVRMIL